LPSKSMTVVSGWIRAWISWVDPTLMILFLEIATA
jgi:hypothetical protein